MHSVNIIRVTPRPNPDGHSPCSRCGQLAHLNGSEKYSRLALGAIRDAGLKHFGVRIHGAGEYPQKLRDADHPVQLLYFQGVWDLVTTRCIVVVGTREPSEDGCRRAAKLARLFVADGFTVVSGLARGIDTVAHTTAIAAGGFTIAVPGTPITECYPRESRTPATNRRRTPRDQSSARCPLFETTLPRQQLLLSGAQRDDVGTHRGHSDR